MANDNSDVVPVWACEPKLENCGLLVKKGDAIIEKLLIIHEKKCVIFGRNQGQCDIKLDHPSISRRHAIIAHGSSGNVYLMDLGSSHGTFKNGKRLEGNKREALSDLDIIKFGASTREYIVRLDIDAPMPALDTLTTQSKQLNTNNKNNNTNNNNNNNNNNSSAINKIKGEKHPHNHHDSQSSATVSGHKRTLAESHNTDINIPDEYNEDLSHKSKREANQVRCSHLLIKHKDSRRPQSWKNKNITITREEAFDKARNFRKQILEQTSSSNAKENNIAKVFEKLATEESDCNSYKRGGDLGVFSLGKMQKPFEEAAFSLKIGELSQPVETASGVHLILRTG